MTVQHQLFSPEDYRLLQECIHCGMCLPACPTYIVNGKEADSPRGRLALMRMLDRDTGVDLAGAYQHIDLCLGCLACETACPSGVQYGHLLEQTRSRQRQTSDRPRWFQRQALKWVTSAARLRVLTALIRLTQRTRLDRLARTLRLLPAALRFQLAGVPALTGRAFSLTHERVLPAVTPGSRRGTVALFTGCIMDQWYGDVHAATQRVLRWNGFDVVIPEGQTCCGALQSHAGESEEAERFLAVNRQALAEVSAEALVVNAAGCGAQLQSSLWPEKEGLPAVDVSVWLAARLSRPPRIKLAQRATYDAPCHLHHAQGATEAPYQILESACERLLPLPDADNCCGGAGAYTLLHGAMSRQVLDRKIDHIRRLDPDLLVTGNPGCQLQLQAGLREAGMSLPVRHTVQALDDAYRLDEAYRDAFELTD